MKMHEYGIRRATAQQSEFKQGLLDGIRACLSIAIAGALVGFVFGVLANTTGLSLFQSGFMSAITYSGAAQLVALDLWSTTVLPIVAIVSAAFILGLRHILMGISLRRYMANISPLRSYLSLFFMIDESWALTMYKAQKAHHTSHYLNAFLIGSGGIYYIFWILSTIIGYLLSASLSVDPKLLGFDFAFTAIFLALAVGLWRGKEDWLPWLAAAAIAIAAKHWIPGNWYIIMGALAGSLVGVWRERF
jgi:4-azaleucine resistance transporter AzlC